MKEIDSMKKTILLGAGLLLSALLTIAQDTAQSGSSTSQPPTTSRSDQTNANSSTLQGCLRGSSGNYTLIDMAGMSYQLTGDESQMKENVNKQVEVTGATGSNASAGSKGATGAGTGAANTGAANSGQTGSTPTDAGTTANRMLTITSIRAVADSCSAEQGK
jgi:hypothetical protein